MNSKNVLNFGTRLKDGERMPKMKGECVDEGVLVSDGVKRARALERLSDHELGLVCVRFFSGKLLKKILAGK